MANATKSSSQLRVLYCEGDEEVLASQAPVLQAAGHQVATAQGRKATEQALRQG